MYQCTSPTPRLGITTNIYNNASIIPIDIYRDGEDSPWGFRLRGGIDVDGGIPLEIIKVRQIRVFVHYFVKEERLDL